MPSSFIDSMPAIVKTLIRLDPWAVVDIGPGWGKYGLACHEYVSNLGFVDAVEVTEGRLPTQDVIYRRVREGDARTFRWLDWVDYNLALMIDVIEHMTKAEGHDLLWQLQKAGCRVLVSTPKVFEPQRDVTNPYETHRSVWGWDDFEPHGVELDISTIDSVIYLLPRQR